MTRDPGTDANHDARGRFAAGNKAGRGNPHHRRVAELRAKMLERVTPNDMAAVVEALVNKAKAGDTAATKLLFDRVFGRIADHDAAAAGERAELEAVQRALEAAALMTDVWVSERKLIGERPPDEYRREAVLVEEMLLPALVRNYVGSCADGHGRIYYALTPAGWAWLDTGDEPPADDLDGEPDGDARAFYYDRVRAALDRLDTAAPPDPKEIGGIPLPVAIEGLKLSAPWTPVAA